MNIRYTIKNQIEDAINSFDWETAIGSALENIDIQDIINEEISTFIENEIDLESIITDIIAEEIATSLLDLDLNEIIKEVI